MDKRFLKQNAKVGLSFYAILTDNLKRIHHFTIVAIDNGFLYVVSDKFNADTKKIRIKHNDDSLTIIKRIELSDIVESSDERSQLEELRKSFIDSTSIDGTFFIECWNNTSNEFKVDNETESISNDFKSKGISNITFKFDGHLYVIDLSNVLVDLVKKGLIVIDKNKKKVINLIADDISVIKDYQKQE